MLHNPNPIPNSSSISGFVQHCCIGFDRPVTAAPLVMVTPPLPLEMPGKLQASGVVSLPAPLPPSPPPAEPPPVPVPLPDPPPGAVPYSTTPRQKSPTGQQATSPASSKAQCWAVVQHQLGSPMEEHDCVPEGQLGGMAGEKGTAAPPPCRWGGEEPPLLV